MNFGRVALKELTRIKFNFPPDPDINSKVLKSKSIKSPRIYVGCAKWGRKEWIGNIYPKGTRTTDFLHEYAKHFNSVELNATHYKLYQSPDLRKWSEQVNPDFRFCPKVYMGISHYGKLDEKQFLTETFLGSLPGLGKNLGPVFLQLNDKFSPERKEELLLYLQRLPRNYNFFIELRHPGWFVEPGINIFRTLHQLKIGAVITDAAGRRDACHMHLTTNKAFIRYVGNDLHSTDYVRLDNWVERLGHWMGKGIVEIYFFMHTHDETNSPLLCHYFIKKMNAAYHLELSAPFAGTATRKKSTRTVSVVLLSNV